MSDYGFQDQRLALYMYEGDLQNCPTYWEDLQHHKHSSNTTVFETPKTVTEDKDHITTSRKPDPSLSVPTADRYFHSIRTPLVSCQFDLAAGPSLSCRSTSS